MRRQPSSPLPLSNPVAWYVWSSAAGGVNDGCLSKSPGVQLNVQDRTDPLFQSRKTYLISIWPIIITGLTVKAYLDLSVGTVSGKYYVNLPEAQALFQVRIRKRNMRLPKIG